jgi:hypothetical protein
MNHEKQLYGELVTASAYEKRETNPENPEEEAMLEQTRLMIQEAAYYLAEKRGFQPGHELEDWLKAKLQILKQ